MGSVGLKRWDPDNVTLDLTPRSFNCTQTATRMGFAENEPSEERQSGFIRGFSVIGKEETSVKMLEPSAQGPPLTWVGVSRNPDLSK